MQPPVSKPKLTPGWVCIYRMVSSGRAAAKYYGLHRAAFHRRDQFRLAGQAAKHTILSAWEPLRFAIAWSLVSVALLAAMAIRNWPGAVVYFEEKGEKGDIPDPGSELILTIHRSK